MYPTTCRPAVALLAMLSLGCSYMEVTTPTGDVALQNLEFGADDFDVGAPLVVFASTANGDVPAQPLTLQASSGGEWQTPLLPLYSGERDPWGHHSDADLAAVIGIWGNHVMIGFKEAGTARGVDEQGRNVTSAETTERMTEWLQKLGVAIKDQWVVMPGVTATIIPDAGLVRQIREHENIDYVNPSGPGEFEDHVAAGLPPNLLAVFQTGSGLMVGSGDLVTAEYRQPDGSVLRATTSIR